MTILIVEDHDAVRRALRTWLMNAFPRQRVLVAASGEEALALAQAECPYLIIMDVRLPGMNGFEATRQIKAAAPTVQVVILTIHEGEPYRTAAAAAGAAAYVPKRAMQTDLLPTVNALLSLEAGQPVRERPCG